MQEIRGQEEYDIVAQMTLSSPLLFLLRFHHLFVVLASMIFVGGCTVDVPVGAGAEIELIIGNNARCTIDKVNKNDKIILKNNVNNKKLF